MHKLSTVNLVCTNILSLIKIRKKNIKVFVISITIKNFINFLLLSFFFKKIKGIIYLRSNGFKEYEIKLGIAGYFIYYLMYQFFLKKLKLITVDQSIGEKKYIKNNIVDPSEISEVWINKKIKHLKFQDDLIKLLYFGRFKKEKGFYSLIEIINNINLNININFAGDNNKSFINQKKISFRGQISSEKKKIALYDNHHILIIPSFTEGSPKVIKESLARKKPIIIFKEIKHVKKNYYGIYVADRNSKSLKNVILHIKSNYNKIQKMMNKNKITTKKNFQKNLVTKTIFLL